MSLEFEDKTFVLRKSFFEVQNEVGKGRDLESYHGACEVWFAEHDVPAVSRLPHPVSLRGCAVHMLSPDFVCWDAISVAMLAQPRRIGAVDFGKTRAEIIGIRVGT
jgi:hypothetical protein